MIITRNSALPRTELTMKFAVIQFPVQIAIRIALRQLMDSTDCAPNTLGTRKPRWTILMQLCCPVALHTAITCVAVPLRVFRQS